MKTYINLVKTIKGTTGMDSALDIVIKQAERYEKLRKLNPLEFSRLYEKHVYGSTNKSFDELVDELE